MFYDTAAHKTSLPIFCSSQDISVGTILIFQISPGPAAPGCRFWYLGSGSYFAIPGFWYKVFRGLFAFFPILVLVRFHFGTILVPNQMEPKALILEPQLTGTLTAQNFR